MKAGDEISSSEYDQQYNQRIKVRKKKQISIDNKHAVAISLLFFL